TAKRYIVATIALGAVVTSLFLASSWEFPRTSQFIALLVLACIASILKVKLPTMHGSISVSFIFFLIGIAGLNLAETLVLGLVATLLQCVWRPKKQPKVIQVLFNVPVVEISIITAFQIPQLFSPPLNGTTALAVSATSFFIANSSLVALVITLVEQRSLQQI